MFEFGANSCSSKIVTVAYAVLYSIPVVLKVGGISPKGAKKTNWTIGGKNNTKWQKRSNHYH